MDPKDGRLRIGDPFGPARPNDDDESSSWPSPGASRGTKRGRDIVGGSDATERSERFVADLKRRPGEARVKLQFGLGKKESSSKVRARRSEAFPTRRTGPGPVLR